MKSQELRFSSVQIIVAVKVVLQVSRSIIIFVMHKRQRLPKNSRMAYRRSKTSKTIKNKKSEIFAVSILSYAYRKSKKKNRKTFNFSKVYRHCILKSKDELKFLLTLKECISNKFFNDHPILYKLTIHLN